MTRSRFYRFLLGAVLSFIISVVVVYFVQRGYVQAIGSMKILISLTGLTFLVASIVGSTMIFRGRIRSAEQFRSVAYIAFLMLGVGGLTGLWAGLPLDQLPPEWSTIGIYLTVINLVLMFVVLPLSAFWSWRRQRQ